MDLSLNHKIKIGFAAAILLMIFITFFSIGSIYSLHQREKDVKISYEAIIKLEEVLSSVKDAETGVNSFYSSEDIKYLQPYLNAEKDLEPKLVELRKLLSDQPDQLENFKKLKLLLNKRIGSLRVFLYYNHVNRIDIINNMFKEGRGLKLMNQTRILVNEMKQYEIQLLNERREITGFFANTTYLVITLGNILAITAIAAAIYFISIDISKRKEAEAALVARQEILENLNHELEAFSYSISHDFRSPLRAIDGFGRILNEEYSNALDQEGNRLLGVIRSNAQKMGQLIEDLLSFSRYSRREVVKRNYNMSELLTEVVIDIKNNNPEWHHILKINKIINAPSDPALLKQVWSNLILNAYKYSSKKDLPVIEIGCSEKNNEVEYFIQDNGEGFDMAYESKLFGIFQRLHSSKEFEGTGVGLAIVKRIITRHGGKITAFGETGKGARFTFTLPL